MSINWQALSLQGYLAIGAGVLVFLAVVLYFTLGAKNTKLPAIIASSIGCLAAGAALAILGMGALGYERQGSSEASAAPGTGAGGGGGMGMMGGDGGGDIMMGGAMGGPPPTKVQLQNLVTKLDQLTQKALLVELNEEQKKKVLEQLQGLAEKEKLTDEDAKKRLDALLDILESQKDTLVAAGYRWPRARVGFFAAGFGRGPLAFGRELPDQNPFKDERGDPLKSLQKRLAKPQG
jgi:hypothetical protein